MAMNLTSLGRLLGRSLVTRAQAGQGVVRQGVAILMLVLACGCVTMQPGYELQDNEIQQWYSQAREVVERRRGVDLQQVALSTVPSREMLFVLSDLYGKKLDPNMTADMRVRVFANKAFAEVGFLQAVYDPFAKRIIVNHENLSGYISRLTAQGAGAREAALTVLIHELVHAADDVEFDLVAIENRHVGDSLGVYMVAEGHAELLTEEYCADAGCSAAFQLARKGYEAPDLSKANSAAVVAARASNMMLLYGQSQKFLKDLKTQDRDGRLLRQAMSNPPGSALDFFDAPQFPDRPRASRRAHIYSVLDSVELTDKGRTLLSVPSSPYDDTVLPVTDGQRLRYVREQRDMIVAAGKMIYINQYDRNASGLSVQLFEATDASAALKKRNEINDSFQDLINSLKRNRIRVRNLFGKEITQHTADLPDNTIINTAHVTGPDGKSVTIYNSLLIDGNYLITVSNSDNPSLNKRALTHVLEQLRLATSY